MVFKANKVWNSDRRYEERRAKWLAESFFYATVKQKDGKDFKVSSLRTIRAAIERYLKQPPINKPWSIVGDPAFETALKVLNAIFLEERTRGKS